MQLKKIFFLFCLLLHITFFLFGQLPSIKSYALEDKNSKLLSLYKTKQGYLLVGTNNGLYKFDGIRFIAIALSKETTDTITSIFGDNNKSIWIGCSNGNIAKTTNGKLQYITPEEGTPQKKITCFLQDKAGNVWFGTNGEGIYYFYNNRLYLIDEINGLADLNIHNLVLTDNGDVLAATDQGINICTVQGTKKTINTVSPEQGLPDYIVTTIEPYNNNQFWIGMQDKGFCLYNHSSKKITTLPITVNWNYGQVNSLNCSQNILWIASQDSGLLKYDILKNNLTVVIDEASNNKDASCITKDKQGNIWFISEKKQLIKFIGNKLVTHKVSPEKILSSSHAILTDKANCIWIANNQGLIKFSGTNKLNIQKQITLPGYSVKKDITSLYQDVLGNIWVGTMGNGIYVVNPVNENIRKLTETTAEGNILSITGSDSTICIASLEGALIAELNTLNNNIKEKYNFTLYNNIESIGTTYIYNVFKDSKGRIWFATDGKGLTVLQNGGYIQYNKKNGIKDGHIYSIAEDKQGNIWFSTAKEGVYCFDGKIFTNYSTQQGLSNISISTIKADANGNIVIVHKNGLDIIDAKTKSFSYINSTQGVSNINDDLGAVTKDSFGNIFIITSGGIVEYVATNDIGRQPETIIEYVQLFLNNIDTAEKKVFNYDENNITFNFTGLYYTNPSGVFYQYKLEGLDTFWQQTIDNSKSFPKLSPGKYVFKVQSSLNKNFANATEASYAFEISNPFWKKWWFVMLSLLLLSDLLYKYIKWREKNVKQVERLQAEKMKFEFELLRNQVNPHFLFNSFNTLISTIEENPNIAVQYVEHLSDFFRNIITYGEKNKISLKEEVDLLQNYLYLQQKRYGSNLQLSINISDENLNSIFLPPLTLQLLMENAIKHNAVSKETQLIVQISTKDNYLIVENNINKKSNKEKGTGMGLQNIINRYALLSKNAVLINNDEKNFTVQLPILN